MKTANKKATEGGKINRASSRLQKERDNLIRSLIEEGKGSDFARLHTELLDRYFIESFESSDIGPRAQFHKKPFAIIALGGYGRQELCLRSDIDILLLFEKAVPRHAAQIAREILYPLWDLGFEVGHATRSIRDCLALADSDSDVLTSLLDARFLCGMSRIYTILAEKLHSSLAGQRAKRAMAELIRRNNERHERFGDSSFLLEPNLKNGRGGLRDYHTMVWTARIRSRITSARDLEFLGYISHKEFSRLNHALQFIWAARNQLHSLAGRKLDQLHFEYQQALAERLGFIDAHGQLAVERFLGRLHSEMAFIKEINTIFLSEISSPRISFLKKNRTRETGVEGLRIVSNRVEFSGSRHIVRKPDLLLWIFYISAKTGLALGWEARRLVAEFLHLIDRRFRRSPANVKIFEKILKARRAATAETLNIMLHTGFLERFIPPVKAIRNRIQYNSYHIYPIDTHSIKTVEIIKSYDNGNHLPLLSDMYHETAAHRHILLWAGLLHDIGKGKATGGHARRGAKIASRILSNMGYGSHVAETVSFLIENHLFLMETATRRDVNDEETAISCARKVKDPVRLKLLYLLTAADAMATGPKAWNDWTTELLRSLFFKTNKILEKGELASQHAVDTVKRKKAALMKTDLPEKEKEALSAHLSILPPRYFLYTAKQQVIEHMRLYHELGDRPFVWNIKPDDASKTRTVTICAKDRPGLFSKIAGAFAINGLDILEAEINTWKNNVALDIFTVRPPVDPIYEEQRWQKTADDLKAALSGCLDIEEALSTQQKARPRAACGIARPDRVVVDNESSGFFTIIEVYAQNRPGLLFHITNALFQNGLDVRIAKIGTKIDQVVDVFYVRDNEGQKIVCPERAGSIKREIERVVSSLFSDSNSLNL